MDIAFFGYILAGVIIGPSGYNLIQVKLNLFKGKEKGETDSC